MGDGAVIGARTIVHPHAVIYDGVTIGDDCVIHAHASIRERCRVGNRVIIQNGAVIGSDGFGFAPRPDGTYQKIPQTAPVVIEDDVEIGANTTIDRPAVGETRIEAGTKIDNLVMVAHGVRVGRNVMLVAQVGISGSTTIGDSSVLAGQVGVAGHLHIGKGTRATAQTGIPNSLPGRVVRVGLPGDRQPRLAQVLGRVQTPARDQEGPGEPGETPRRRRGQARRRSRNPARVARAIIR